MTGFSEWWLVLAPNLTQNCNEKNSILFLSSMFSSWRKDQWVPVPEPILDLVTSLNQKARPSVALQAFLPVCAVCARALCAEPHGREGSVERPPAVVPESPVPALKVSSGNTLLSYHPGIHLQIHTPPPQRDEERLGNQETGTSKLYVGVMCWSFLSRDPWIVLTGRTWWRN